MATKRDKALKAYEAGDPVNKIVRDAGISTLTFYRWLEAAGIPLRNRSNGNSGKVLQGNSLERAIEMYPSSGLKAIADELDSTAYIVRKSLLRAGVELRESRFVGEGQ